MSGRSLHWLGMLCLLATQARAADPAFQFTKAVESPALEEEELLSVRRDVEVYEATQDDLADVRLRDSDDHPVPFVLRKVQTTRKRTVRNTWTAREPSVRPLAGGGLEITVALQPQDPPASGLTLITPLDNFEKRIRVEMSADGREWEAAGEETLIFDYSRYMDVRQDSVSFPETARRQFRIVIDDVTVRQESELLELTRRLRGAGETERVERFVIERRPFRIDRLQFSREVERESPDEDVTRTYPPVDFHVEQAGDEQQTHILIDTRREPLTSLEITTDARNFSRAAIVDVEDLDGVRRTWRTIGRATLSRIDFKGMQREQLAITFPETRRDRFRIVIDNRDSPPLDITGIVAKGIVYEAAFIAAPDERYRLVYGDAEADPAEYDTAALWELLRSGFAATPVRLGDAEARPGSGQPRALQWPEVLNNPLLLAVVIAVLVMALGFGLFHAAKRIDAAPPQDGAPGRGDTIDE